MCVTFFRDLMKRLKENLGQTDTLLNNVEENPFQTFFLLFLQHFSLVILKDLDQRKVDYLSLDVEGNELDILKTIPFDKIDVKENMF